MPGSCITLLGTAVRVWHLQQKAVHQIALASMGDSGNAIRSHPKTKVVAQLTCRSHWCDYSWQAALAAASIDLYA